MIENSLNKMPFPLLLLALIIFNSQCTNQERSVEKSKTSIEKGFYGTNEKGEQVDQYIMKNGTIEMSVITYGGIITHLSIPNKSGVLEDIVLGYDSLAQYIASSPYFGAIVGRYGNRIAKGNFAIDGQEYSLATNNGANHLHGGPLGFDKVIWKALTKTEHDAAILELSYLSKDGEEGYPGNLMVKVTYTLRQDNTLAVAYEASTDKSTVVNLTQHSYFNLSGDFSKNIGNHLLHINADRYLPVDEGLIPTAELASVESTPFDFRKSKMIDQDINAVHEQIERGSGFDHCWVLNKGGGQEMPLAASVYHAESGRFLEIFTDEPGVQFYSGNFLDASLPAKGGGFYPPRSGLCLETQHYPNSPNEGSFPTTRLDPDEIYRSNTLFKFSTK